MPTRPVLIPALSSFAVAAVLGAALTPAAFAAPTPPATASPTVTASPTRPNGVQRALSVTVTPPQSPDGPATLRITGATPGVEIEGSAGRHSNWQAEATGLTTAAADGTATLELRMNEGRWPTGAKMLWGVSQRTGDGRANGAFTVPAWPGAPTVEAVAPATPTDPYRVTIRGMKPGEFVQVTGMPEGWTEESPYMYEVQQKGDPTTLVIPAPSAGWPVGTKYVFFFKFANDSVSRSFVVSGKKPTQAPKTGEGGLAKTGH